MTFREHIFVVFDFDTTSELRLLQKWQLKTEDDKERAAVPDDGRKMHCTNERDCSWFGFSKRYVHLILTEFALQPWKTQIYV